MHNGMSLQDMMGEVIRHSDAKVDFVANTKENICMVAMPDFDDGVALVVQKVGTDSEAPILNRFEITDNCHKQIAARLKIYMPYYRRMLSDHRDLLMQNVNAWFEKEPELRMVRTLDGRARAFLSNSFRRVDNEQILERTLPVIRNDFETTMLNTHVDEDRMRLKCLFTGDEHKVDLGKTKNGNDDIVHAGFEMGNSEVGRGSFFIRGFFFRDYCTNGCVFGTTETASMKQIHVGSRLGITADMILSNATMRKEDELIISAARDVLVKLASPEFTQQLGNKLRALKETESVKAPIPAVENVCETLRLSEGESASVLESFIREGDYSQWGMVNAVTQLANTTERYSRSCDIEEAGNTIINLPANQWHRVAELLPLAA